MRIWSLHPSLLDRQGLIACWRETLLAQKVLDGKTKGYRNHPQLTRFRACSQPLAAIGAYLSGLADEADSRGYSFNRGLILTTGDGLGGSLTVTCGQLAYERDHLADKLTVRDPDRLPALAADPLPAHPLFAVVDGDVEAWERRS